MGRRRRAHAAHTRLAALGVCAVVLAACSSTADGTAGTDASADRPAHGQSAAEQDAGGQDAGGQGAGGQRTSYGVADPGPMKGPLLTPDVLISSGTTIPKEMRRRLADIRGVSAVMPLSLASLSVSGRTLTIAAVDPARYRRFTPVASAQADVVWRRVAGGEIAVDPTVGKRLERPAQYMKLGNREDAPALHIGAYAPLSKRFQVVMNRPRGDQIEMPVDNALLVSTGKLTPSVLTGKMKRIIGRTATLQVLATEFDVDIPQTAVLAGGAVTRSVGSFTYTPHADGTVTPDPAWVAANIRTESVPILGAVRCHRVMLPQLRGALTEVVQQGLASTIHPSEYGGCYYPRYIGHDPSKGLSLHTWGIAVDLNVPENQRGTAGQIDRRVVAIFKKWGFAWGGDWSYTDPMHFELTGLVRSG